MKLNQLRVAVLIASGAFISLGSAHATSIPITNASFETAPGGIANIPFLYNGGPIAGWTSDGAAGIYNPLSADNGGTPSTYTSVPDGVTVAYINGGEIYQQIGTVTPGLGEYTMNVWIGERNDGTPALGSAWLQINNPDNSLVLDTALATSSCTLSSGTWCLYTATVPESAAVTYAGDPLYIVLSSSGVQGDFDAVSASVPEDGSGLMYLLLAAGSCLGAMVFKSRNSVGALQAA